MSASKRDEDKHNDFGQFGNSKSRRARHIIWFVGFMGLVVAMAFVASRLPEHSPPTPEEYLLGLFPMNFTGFEPIQNTDVELHSVSDTDSGPVEYAVAYYPARERFSEDLLGLELRIDHYATAGEARRRIDEPHISLDWGFEGFELDWLIAGYPRDLPDSDTNVVVDMCTWPGLSGSPLAGGLFYSWVRDNYRFQLALVGDPSYIMSDEGESHMVFAWGDVRRRWKP